MGVCGEFQPILGREGPTLPRVMLGQSDEVLESR